MSVFQDVWAFVGPKGVPVVLATVAFAVFEFLEKVSSDEAKSALAKAVRSLDVHSARALPDGTRELFERIFGSRHFSIKCFRRSALFSVASILFLVGLAHLLFPWLNQLSWLYQAGARFGGPSDLDGKDILEPLWRFLRSLYGVTFLTTWVFWSIIPDYINLYKTRLCLEILSKVRIGHPLGVLLILICDFAVTTFVFFLGAVLISPFASGSVPYRVRSFSSFSSVAIQVFNAVTFNDLIILSVLFYAGLMPSVWLWLYVVSLLVTRIISRSGPVVDRLRWFLSLDKYPFRSVGVVAGGLMFLASALVMTVIAYL
jgi:hypothetical protein